MVDCDLREKRDLQFNNVPIYDLPAYIPLNKGGKCETGILFTFKNFFLKGDACGKTCAYAFSQLGVKISNGSL